MTIAKVTTPEAVFAMLRAVGWTLTQTANSHTKCTPPNGRGSVYASFSLTRRRHSADPRALRNFLRDLRRYTGWQP